MTSMPIIHVFFASNEIIILAFFFTEVLLLSL